MHITNLNVLIEVNNSMMLILLFIFIHKNILQHFSYIALLWNSHLNITFYLTNTFL